ncbi:MAG TPA: lamin tail domain-containing protein, partial [Candidatus Eisenbacteria bacterium]|nr:lamin tail domain-containing protein [Candidatus Eisenbacteria bacterium]
AVIRGILNEVRPGAGGGDTGFLEVFNPTSAPLALGGYVVSFGGAEMAALPGGPDLAPGGFRAFTGAVLGANLPNRNDVCMLLAPDGKTFVDAMEVREAPAGSSSARFPDGGDDVFVTDTPTQGASNAYVPFTAVVINEIHFHPPYIPPAGACIARCSDADQWIELWNRSGADVELGGWSLTKGVEIVLPAGTRIRAGAALVIAANVARFQAENPGVTDVVGGWTGRLAHDTDTINLRDALGNRVDHVKYGDGGPRNDEDPRDGVDDGTFRASAWPPDADGSGRTLELVHPGLDNRGGHAWRASALPGGTPGAQNSAFDSTPAPVIDQVRHSPAVPRSTDTVRVRARISSIQAITTATLEWSPDGTPLQPVVLRDDGTGADAKAGDGEYAASIPARFDGTVIRFRITATSAGGSLTVPVPPDIPPYFGFSGP